MEYELVRKTVELELRVADLELVVKELQEKVFPERFKEKKKESKE